MYPRAHISLHAEIPSTASFWTPSPDDVGEYGGLGFFDNVWAIDDATADKAHDMLHKDRSLCQLISHLAEDESQFDTLANAVETGVADDSAEIQPSQLAALRPYLTEVAALEGLEIGVAGLVYALSAAGTYTEASCRGHPGRHAWSNCPVVLVALDRPRAEILQPLIENSNCGFEIDQLRPDLLSIVSQTIEATLALGEAVVGRLNVFRRIAPAP
jgi:hypothetical protein